MASIVRMITMLYPRSPLALELPLDLSPLSSTLFERRRRRKSSMCNENQMGKKCIPRCELIARLHTCTRPEEARS
jgi:hypothetical protein